MREEGFIGLNYIPLKNVSSNSHGKSVLLLTGFNIPSFLKD